MFSFMKQSKHRNLAGNEGVYLADISSGAIDPEVAALYFNTTKKQSAGMLVIDCGRSSYYLVFNFVSSLYM